MERLVQRFAESAQQMVGTQSVGVEKSLGATDLVGAKETREPPTSSGESVLNSQAEGLALHLWSLTLWSCPGAFEQMMIGLLRNVVAKERDPAVADKVTMMGRKTRLLIQLYYVIALTCRRRVSLAVRRVFSFGFEAWKQLCREFEPWVSSRFQWMLQAPLQSTRTDGRCGKFKQQSGDRSSENVELAVSQKCLESSLTDQTCSQAVRRRCATLLAMRQPNSSKQDRQERCLGLWNARTCRHLARAKAARRAREPPSAWRSFPSWTAQFQLARTAVWRFDRFLLIHFDNSSLIPTVFLLVSPLSTVTTIAFKLRTALVFYPCAFLCPCPYFSCPWRVFLSSLSPHTASTSIGASPIVVEWLGCHDPLATE